MRTLASTNAVNLFDTSFCTASASQTLPRLHVARLNSSERARLQYKGMHLSLQVCKNVGQWQLGAPLYCILCYNGMGDCEERGR